MVPHLLHLPSGLYLVSWVSVNLLPYHEYITYGGEVAGLPLAHGWGVMVHCFLHLPGGLILVHVGYSWRRCGHGGEGLARAPG